MRAFAVIFALTALAPTLGCAAVYPEVQTPLRDPQQGKDMTPPKGVYWIAFKEAVAPEKTRDGRPWHELGSKLPDPYAVLFVNGKELIKTNAESSTLHPTWPDSPRGNFRITDADRLRVEMWESGLVKKPMCVADLRGNEDDWVASKKIDVDCESGARVVLSFEPPHGKIGYGFYYELRSEGAAVTRVFEESPAAKAGIRAGDLIVTLGDRPAKSMSSGEIQSYLNAPKMEGIKVTVKHKDGQTADVEVHEGPVFPLFSEIGPVPLAVRDGKASLTAEWVAAIRAAAGDLPEPIRGAHDPIARELLSLPTRAILGAIELLPGTLGFLVSDAVSRGLVANVVLRTLRIDEAVRTAASRGARQLVIVGAGYDARAYRLDGIDEVTVFEVDHPSTQREKTARLGAARARAKRVVHVAVDFESQSLERELDRAGFDRATMTVWIWEGVTMYLTPAARRGTLGTIAAMSAIGSDVVLTYFRGSALTPIEGRLASLSARVIGEPLRGLVESDELRAELEANALAIVEDGNAVDWAARYWPRWHGKVMPWERIAIARKR